MGYKFLSFKEWEVFALIFIVYFINKYELAGIFVGSLLVTKG